MSDDAWLERVVRELSETHACHTVILYGSRARGDATPQSDWDLAGFCADLPKRRDARLLDGRYLDAFVYAQSDAAASQTELLRLRGGRILLDRQGFGARLMASLESVFAAGPAPLPPDEVQLRHVWLQKMLARAATPDLEGRYRFIWLQYDLLETYFNLRTLWYEGPKASFRWLAAHDPVAYRAFSTALAPNAGVAEITALVEIVRGKK